MPNSTQWAFVITSALFLFIMYLVQIKWDILTWIVCNILCAHGFNTGIGMGTQVCACAKMYKGENMFSHEFFKAFHRQGIFYGQKWLSDVFNLSIFNSKIKKTTA